MPADAIPLLPSIWSLLPSTVMLHVKVPDGTNLTTPHNNGFSVVVGTVVLVDVVVGVVVVVDVVVVGVVVVVDVVVVVVVVDVVVGLRLFVLLTLMLLVVELPFDSDTDTVKVSVCTIRPFRV
jgi:hypothetical protein